MGRGEHGSADLSHVHIVAGQVRQLQLQGDSGRVGLTNGTFDVLHPGHVHMIEDAASRVDYLIVALDDDEGVRQLKGPGRPLRTLADRAALVAGLKGVWRVIAFGPEAGYSVEDLLDALRPDLYICRGEPISPEAARATALGIDVVPLPRHGHWSTTDELRTWEHGLWHRNRDAAKASASGM